MTCIITVLHYLALKIFLLLEKTVLEVCNIKALGSFSLPSLHEQNFTTSKLSWKASKETKKLHMKKHFFSICFDFKRQTASEDYVVKTLADKYTKVRL